MRLLAAILVLMPALATAQPPASFHDLPIAEPVTRPFSRYGAAHVASDGDGFLAVWTDFRALNPDVYGARFTAAGEPLDPEGFVVHATYQQESSTTAVWNGTDYAVFSSSSQLGVWQTLVSPAGEVRGAPDERLGVQNAEGFAAWNGSRYAQTSLTFNGTANTLELVLRDEQFAIRRRVALSDRVPPGIRPRVATDGRVFLVLWDDQQTLFTAIVDGNGNVTAAPFALAGTVTGADAAWNGTSFLVTFSAADGVRAVPVAPDGTRGAEKLVAADTRLPVTAVAWNGHAHLVLWSTFDETRGALVTASGDPIETFEVADRGGVAPAVASDGDVFFAVAGGETFVIRSTGSTRIVRRGPLANAYPQQTSPALAAGETNVLTAWIENGSDIRMNRRTRSGTALDGSGVLVASVPRNVQQVKVFAARGFYVIAWRTSLNEVRIARVTEGGEVIDPGGILLAADGTEAVVAGNAAETRVVWGRLAPAVPLAMIELVTATLPERGPIGAPGVVALPVPPIGRSRAIRLFPNGNRFTLLYEVSLPGPRLFSFELHLRSLVLDAGGQPSAPVTLVENGVVFDAATDGRSIVIAWNRDGMHTRRLELDGIPGGPPVPLNVPGAPFLVTIARTATGFVVLQNFSDRVAAAYLDRDGDPIAPSTTLLDGFGLLAYDAAFAGGQTWVTYTSPWAPLPEVHGGAIARAWLHVIGPRRRAVR